MSTELYRRIIAFDHGNAETNELTRHVWSPTPWVLDVYTGSTNSQSDLEMRGWLHDTFGREAWPLHRRQGRWQRGGATIHGWTWIGFAAESDMRKFIAAFPDYDTPGIHRRRNRNGCMED